MADRKVKGTMVVDHVRMIRANKGRDWDKYLKPQDWEIVNGRILPSMWYPLETYQRCGWATYQVLAGGNLDLVRLRGRIRGKELFEDIYKNIVIDQNPMKALDRFVIIYGQLFNFSTLEFEKVGEKHARIHHDYDPNDPGSLPYCYQLMGHFDTLIEMTGGKNVKIELIAKQWEGAPETIFNITWE